jgi:hypothetical protein
VSWTSIEKRRQAHRDWYNERKDNPEFRAYWNEKAYKYRAKDARRLLLRNAKQRAKQLNLPFNIDVADINIPEICPLLKKPLQVSYPKSKGGNDFSPSLDRIIPCLGYVKGNVWVISRRANSMKSNATQEDLRNFANWVLSTG